MESRQRAAVLGEMLRTIVHRGPDSEGRIEDCECPASIGMRRLSIIDIDGGTQPLWNEDGTVGVVFNGEIYNFREHRADLTERGHVFRTQSDTEVLVHLYEEHGTEMFTRLRGMFGLALLDYRNRRMVLARDHFGQKPLYYFSGRRRFAFASEIKALLQVPFVPTLINERAYLDYLCWLSLPAPETHFCDIRKLPPASYMTVSLDDGVSASPVTYWRFGETSQGMFSTMEEAAGAFDTVFADSIRKHFHADVPVGLLLSSGLDSMCVGLFARQVVGQQLKTFSVGTDSAKSEHVDAQCTAEAIDSDHRFTVISGDEFAAELESTILHLDEPIGDPAAAAVRRVCRMARSHVKVLMSGEGADELFAGYAGRYQSILSQVRRSDILRRVRWLVPKLGPDYVDGRWSRIRQRAHLVRAAEVVALRSEGVSLRSANTLLRDRYPNLLAERHARHAERVLGADVDLLKTVTDFDIGWQLPESLLQKADKMSMAASVELRCPFLDIEVAAVAARIQPRHKLNAEGTGKLVLRRAVEARMPGGGNTAKRGFILPLRRWLTGPLQQMVSDLVLSKRSYCGEVFKTGVLNSKWDACVAGDGSLAPLFYSLLVYELWKERIVGKRTP